MSYKTTSTFILLAFLTFNVKLTISSRMDCCVSDGSYKVEKIPGSKVGLGEGPHWDIPSQSLYYVDIYGGSLCRFSSQERKVYKCKIGEFEDCKLDSILVNIPTDSQKMKH